MFSNTPVGTHRTKHTHTKVHGPPGDQPSYPIRRVTRARDTNIDPNAISLSNSIDDRRIADAITESMASPPRAHSNQKPVASAAEIRSAGNHAEQANLHHNISPFRQLRSFRMDRAQLESKVTQCKVFF